MKTASVNIYPWESPKLLECDIEDLKKGEWVIISSEYASEMGMFLGFSNESGKEDVQGKIIRRAEEKDKQVFLDNEKDKEGFLEICKDRVKKTDLAMKVVDARISLDKKQATFFFTAEGRIDFRELVRTLSRDLKKTIRMQQIGCRDEARKLGGFGVCGRNLCCVSFSGNIQSITTDMARVQQIAHRGTERISGLCGRLMCCLSYEADQYKEMLIGMPEIYSILETKDGKGTVIDVNAITEDITVKLESGKYLNIKKKDLK